MHGEDNVGVKARDSIKLLKVQIGICESEVTKATTIMRQLRAVLALVNENISKAKLVEGKGGYRAAGLHNLTRQDSDGNPTTDL